MATDDFDTRGIDYILNMINEQNAQNAKDNNNFVQEIVKGVSDVKNEAKLTNKAMDARTKAIIDYLKKSDVASDKLIEYIKEVNGTLQEFKKETGKQVSSDIYASAMTDVLGRAHQQSVYAGKHGGEPLLKYGKGSDDLQGKLRELVDTSLDKSTEKIIAFYQGTKTAEESQKKKDAKNFISGFIDELGRSKLFGGTFMDFIKLITYSVASWLKRFGMPGKVIGLAIIGAAPVVASAIARALKNVFVNSLGRIVGKLFGRSAAGSVAGGAAPIGGKVGGLAKLGKLGRFGKLLTGPGAIVSSLASFGIGALASKGEETSSGGYSKAFGFAKGATNVGGWLLGAAGILGMTGVGAPVAAVLGVLGGIATAIGGIVAVVTAIAKNWNWIKDFGHKILVKLGLIADDKGGRKGFLSFLPGFDGSPKSATPEEWKVADEKRLKRDKYGRFTNLTELTQERGWEEIQRARKEDPVSFNKYYEIISKKDPRAKHINFGAFQTDYRSPEGDEILLGKGVLDSFIEMKRILKGYKGHENREWTDRELDLMLLTSGAASFGSSATGIKGPHKDTRSKVSHGSPYINTFDISAISGIGKESVENLNKSFFEDLRNTKQSGKFGQLLLAGDKHDIHASILPSLLPGGQGEIVSSGNLIKIVQPKEEKEDVVTKTEVKKDTKESKGEVAPISLDKEQSTSAKPSIGEQIGAVELMSGNELTSRALQSIFTISMFGGTDSYI